MTPDEANKLRLVAAEMIAQLKELERIRLGMEQRDGKDYTIVDALNEVANADDTPK